MESDEDEVPVVMLDNEDDEPPKQPTQQQQTSNNTSPQKRSRRIKKKKGTISSNKSRGTKPSSPANNNSVEEANQQQPVPPIFSMAGSIMGRAQEIFSPPNNVPKHTTNSQYQSQTVPNTPAAAAATTSFKNNDPQPASSIGYFSNFSQPQLQQGNFSSPNLNLDLSQQDKLQDVGGGGEDEDNDDDDDGLNKSKQTDIVKMIKDLLNSPAVLIAAVSVGFLIVHQKDSIEIYLHEGIGMLFSCINYLTIAGALIGGVILLVKYVILKGVAYMNEQSKPKQKKHRHNKRHTSPRPVNDNNEMKNFTNDDLAAAAAAAAAGGGGFPPQPFGQQQPQLFRRPTNSSGIGALPRLDTTTQQQQQQAGRSFSQPNIPPILNPTPVYADPNTGSFFSDYGPQTAPLLESAANQHSSYFSPQYDINSNNNSFENNNDGFKSPFQASPRASGGPPSLIRNNSSSSPLQMPTLFSDSEGDESDNNNIGGGGLPRMPEADEYYEPIRDYSPKKRTVFTNPKRVVFRRREPEPEKGKKEPDSYVDDFSCKPYGAPPKRYHGVNV